MNVSVVVDKFLGDELLGRHQLSENLWLSCESTPTYKDFTFLVSTCPGGAYSQFGSLRVGEDAVVVQLKTVWGIIRHRSEFSSHRFDFCNPDFPNNVVELVKLAAVNSQRCFSLAHKRCWGHWRRNVASTT